ncbi:UbiA family prenyltransferase [Saccharothrix coeruleofusca]|uniref:Membrane protein n=1 Tax=Saccharothrix coeruleofusca TaxID=33919 RepID=A0A918EG38_9PSEU|nr:UbiA family prenyltransferase [Saccharothrix coeruleofusca]GGP68802.1 membrane protein [Saccharothrix coeruleofusca]
MPRLPALVRACHPLPALAVTAVSTAVAATAGRTGWGLVGVAAAVLTGQLSVGWLNDALDARRDAAVDRRDKPVVTGEVSRRSVAVAAGIAAPLAVVLSLLAGPLAAAAHVVALISAWAYDLGLKGTAFSVAPYAVSFGLLPAYLVIGTPGHPWPPAWLVAAGAVLGSAAHFANVLPDIDDDLATGVRGLPHRLGARASAVLAAALVLLASVVLVLGPAGPVSPAGLVALPLSVAVLVVGGLRARRPGSRAAFNALLLVAVIDVVLLVVTGAAAL